MESVELPQQDLELDSSPEGLSRRVLVGLACGIALLFLLTVALGVYVYRQGYGHATNDYGYSIAKMGYDRLN